MTPLPISRREIAHFSQPLAKLGTQEDEDDELGEAVAEAEPHAVEVDLFGDAFQGGSRGMLGYADDGEGQPGDEIEYSDDEGDVVVPGALREVLVHPL
ncbi:hypothetical protein ACOMHN_065997 [Nucella lapillus]